MPRRPNHPYCYIIAGSNGAGKTTFATEFLPRYADCVHFINPDLIAKGLSPFYPETAMSKAGRLVLEQIAELSQARVDFAFETTLSGRTYVHIVQQLRSLGYLVHLFYLWIPDPDLALLRIRERVAHGGHNVHPKDVRRRFGRTIHNLFHLYRPLVDTLCLFDNSTRNPRLVMEERDGKPTVYDDTLYQQIIERVHP